MQSNAWNRTSSKSIPFHEHSQLWRPRKILRLWTLYHRVTFWMVCIFFVCVISFFEMEEFPIEFNDFTCNTGAPYTTSSIDHKSKSEITTKMPPKPKFGDGKHILTFNLFHMCMFFHRNAIKIYQNDDIAPMLLLLLNIQILLFGLILCFRQAKRFYVFMVHCCTKPKHWKAVLQRIRSSNTLFIMLDGTISKKSHCIEIVKRHQKRWTYSIFHYILLVFLL